MVEAGNCDLLLRFDGACLKGKVWNLVGKENDCRSKRLLFGYQDMSGIYRGESATRSSKFNADKLVPAV